MNKQKLKYLKSILTSMCVSLWIKHWITKRIQDELMWEINDRDVILFCLVFIVIL